MSTPAHKTGKLFIPSEHEKGFSLIELAIVMTIVTFTFVSLVSGMTHFLDNSRVSKTKQDLENIRESMIGFAIENNRLPCPSSKNCSADNHYNPDGRENWEINDGVCGDNWGFVPYKTLGVNGRDPWGNHYVYRVGSGKNGFNKKIDLKTRGNINIKDSANPDGSKIATNIAAAIYSIGPNQGNGKNSISNLPSMDEAENFSLDCTSADRKEDETLISKDFVPENSVQDEFDDVMLWLSSFVIKARLSQAGVF